MSSNEETTIDAWAFAGQMASDGVNEAIQAAIDAARKQGATENQCAVIIMATLGFAVEEWISRIAGPEPSTQAQNLARALAREFAASLTTTDWAEAITTHCSPD